MDIWVFGQKRGERRLQCQWQVSAAGGGRCVPGVIRPFRPVKHLQAQGGIFNTITRLLRDILHGKCVFGDLCTGNVTLWAPTSEAHKSLCLAQVSCLPPLQTHSWGGLVSLGPVVPAPRPGLGLLALTFGGDHLEVLAPMAWSPCSFRLHRPTDIHRSSSALQEASYGWSRCY